jgi:cytochrome c-type biogenesis protein CcmH/NrfG/peroxiredoxin
MIEIEVQVLSRFIRVSFLSLIVALICAPESHRVSAQDAPKTSAVDPKDDFQQLLNSGRLLAAQGQLEAAIEELRRAAKLHDDKCAECFQMIGHASLQLGKLKEAEVAFRQAAELKPSNEAEMYNVLGVVLYLQNEKESFEQAAAALQRAIELSKGSLVKAYYNLGFALIKAGREQQGIAALKKFLELAPAANEAAQARAVIVNTRMVDAKVAPSFSVKSHTGEDLSLEKLRGKIVLLDFWASWCGPCRVDMPEVRTIWKKYGGDQFVVIGINLDSNRAAFEAYAKEQGVTWPQYYDGLGWGNKISQLYRVFAIPHTILIDQDGVIQATGFRGGALSDMVGNLLKKLQKQTNATTTK